jgi:hypothetical protein
LLADIAATGHSAHLRDGQPSNLAASPTPLSLLVRPTGIVGTGRPQLQLPLDKFAAAFDNGWKYLPRGSRSYAQRLLSPWLDELCDYECGLLEQLLKAIVRPALRRHPP